MKTTFTILVSALMLCTSQLFSKNPIKIKKYKRSSLAMILIKSGSFPDKSIVMQAWDNYPFPDKYNDHSVGVDSMNPAKFVVTRQDMKKAGLHGILIPAKGNTGSPDVNNGVKEMPIKIAKFIRKRHLAKKLVSKWFDRDTSGTFDMKLIEKRGFYNASVMDAAVAAHKIRGLASLGDAGEQLINNTFVAFSRLTFVSNEPIARAIRDIAIKTIKQKVNNLLAQKLAILAANKVYQKTKEGYSVWTHTWLYKLVWNDSIANVFYTKLWNDTTAFDHSHIFRMKYVGMAASRSLVTFSLKKGQAHRTKAQIVDLATGRNIDKVFAKLQKNFDVFKPKVPVLSVDPIRAHIGLKEGIKPGDKFEALEMKMDPHTGKTTYVKVGKVIVSRKFPIWDDRYDAGLELASKHKKHKKSAAPVTATTFKGSKKIQPGMLLVQIK